MTPTPSGSRMLPIPSSAPAPLSDVERRALWVVMPCYNEDGALRGVVSDVAAQGFSVVLVDDGSATTAADLVAGSGAHVLRHCVNLGQGAALQTGID